MFRWLIFLGLIYDNCWHKLFLYFCSANVVLSVPTFCFLFLFFLLISFIFCRWLNTEFQFMEGNKVNGTSLQVGLSTMEFIVKMPSGWFRYLDIFPLLHNKNNIAEVFSVIEFNLLYMYLDDLLQFLEIHVGFLYAILLLFFQHLQLCFLLLNIKFAASTTVQCVPGYGYCYIFPDHLG